jgi:Tol biopolymer transport system component
MSLAPGDRLGPYVIEARIGSGGMGEVYRARDTRLDRAVAIKTITAAFSDRFEREARAISALNHPHICTLHDVGREADTAYLVMELVDGSHPKGPLPVETVIQYAIQICSALEAAHKAGIVHRDLKPANIIVTRQGVKLLDFGLAKPQPAATGPAADGPTMAVVTAAHTVLGTLQYMAPEQVEGGDADARSDIFALGCVLYEFLTGKPAFVGKSSSAIMAAIVATEPRPIHELQPIAPAALEHLVANCLAKDPDDRCQSAHDVRLQLEWIRDHGSQSVVTVPHASRRQWLVGAAAAVLLVAAAAFAWGYLWRPTAVAPRLRLSLNLPPGFRLDDANAALALSPDGQRLAIAASGPESNQRLWIRPLAGDQPQALAGTEDATYPFWSPDGTSLGFFAGGKLKALEVVSGSVRTIADAPNGRGASWGADDTIAFAPDYRSALFIVSAAGGAPQQVTKPGPAGSHRMPAWLPGGRRLLFFSYKTGGEVEGILAFDRTTGKTHLVASESSAAQFVAPDLILFLRGQTLMAQAFDAAGARTTGAPVVIAESVDNVVQRASGQYSAAGRGALVYHQWSAAGDRRRITVYQADGTRIADVGAPSAMGAHVFVSPDGRRVATIEAENDSNATVWVYDIATGVRTPLRFGDGVNIAWSPDGTRLAFSTNAGAVGLQPVDLSAPPRIIWKNTSDLLGVTAWTADGKALSVVQQTAHGVDVGLLTISPDPRLTTIVNTPAWELNATFASDNRAMAYTSNQTGRYEVFVAPYPAAGGSVQVTSGGGQHPQWINGGREIAYLNDERKLYASEILRVGSQLTLGRTRALFGGHALPVTPGEEGDREASAPVYLTPDGSKVVLAVPTDLESVVPLTLLSNWR